MPDDPTRPAADPVAPAPVPDGVAPAPADATGPAAWPPARPVSAGAPLPAGSEPETTTPSEDAVVPASAESHAIAPPAPALARGEERSDGAGGRDPAPIEADLTAVDDALARLDAGTYGTCEVCRDPLPAEVLAEDPMARFCTGHLSGTLG